MEAFDHNREERLIANFIKKQFDKDYGKLLFLTATPIQVALEGAGPLICKFGPIQKYGN